MPHSNTSSLSAYGWLLQDIGANGPLVWLNIAVSIFLVQSILLTLEILTTLSSPSHLLPTGHPPLNAHWEKVSRWPCWLRESDTGARHFCQEQYWCVWWPCGTLRIRDICTNVSVLFSYMFISIFWTILSGKVIKTDLEMQENCDCLYSLRFYLSIICPLFLWQQLNLGSHETLCRYCIIIKVYNVNYCSYVFIYVCVFTPVSLKLINYRAIAGN